MDIKKYLEDLENRIDAEQEEKLLADYWRFARRQMKDVSYFKPSRTPSPSNITWEKVYFNDTFDDFDAMIYKQLLRVNDQLTEGGGELFSFRSNYGTGLIPSMLGCKVSMMPREQDNLPAPLPMEWEDVLKINEDFRNGWRADVRSGLGQKSLDAAHYLQEVLRDYPKLEKYLHIYQPDTQGPCSLVEAILGSEFYYLVYDEEDEIRDFTEVVTDTFIRYLQMWKEEFPHCNTDYSFDYGLLLKGGVMIREDACTNITSDMYEDFFMEADQKILDAFGGGGVHFCGHGDHLLDAFSRLRGMTAVNMSQPDMNDMDGVVYPNTIDKDIQIIGMAKFEARRCDRKHIDLKGMVHVGLCVAAWMGEPEKDPRGED